ncbi:MAG: hypothetical protein JSW66_15305 [Phycisphaerales bacterium]|nr:MAG: hypothetical protein JSW66_15305 [Phycisphaerales bacterium]
MYKEEILAELAERYERNISWNLEKVIKPVLTKRERAELQDVRLQYPLIGRGGDPFRYFATVEGKSRIIEMPVLSVKFLDDLATAAAWLEIKGLSTETLPAYVSMLKYQDIERFPGGRYPTPLEALLPADRRHEREVDELAQDLLKTNVVYILSRELGSIHFSSPYTLKKASWQPQQIGMKPWGQRSRQQDLVLQCDAFALEIMRRIGVPPHRLTFYLSAQAYWTRSRIDFDDDEEVYLSYWHNPPGYAMFPERLHQIADLMVWGKEDYARQQDDKLTSTSQIEQAARKIFRLSYVLEKQSMQWEVKQKALGQTIEDLRP